MPYIKNAKLLGCFFCAFLKQKDDAKNLILLRGKACFCIINKYPYNTGHVMVAPMAHKGKLSALRDDEILELWSMTSRVQAALHRAMKPHGYNLGINIGRTAGAGVPGHLHLHMVPRWTGDTNYMPVTGGAKVMPMALNELYQILRRSLKATR